MDKIWLIELMKLPSIGLVEELPLLNAYMLLNQYGKIDIISDKDGKVFYQCDINEIISNGINEDIILKLSQNGWSLNEDNSKIIKKI